jgi:hypothetical protein
MELYGRVWGFQEVIETIQTPQPNWSAFTPFASMVLREDNAGIQVHIIDEVAGTLTEAVYVWLGPEDAIIRIGTSKQPVARRMLQYPKHINSTLAGLPSPTPPEEAENWVRLVKASPIRALVHQPPLVQTVCGPIRPYLDIERTLLSSFKTQLNRSHR